MISGLLKYLGLSVNRKGSKQERMKRLIDNDPVLNNIDNKVSDMNNLVLDRLKKENSELYKLIKQFR